MTRPKWCIVQLEIARKAYYNIYREEISIEEVIEYLEETISQYATIVPNSINFNPRKHKEIIPEVLAKNNSNASAFTKEFIRLLKGV